MLPGLSGLSSFSTAAASSSTETSSPETSSPERLSQQLAAAAAWTLPLLYRHQYETLLQARLFQLASAKTVSSEYSVVFLTIYLIQYLILNYFACPIVVRRLIFLRMT